MIDGINIEHIEAIVWGRGNDSPGILELSDIFKYYSQIRIREFLERARPLLVGDLRSEVAHMRDEICYDRESCHLLGTDYATLENGHGADKAEAVAICYFLGYIPKNFN